MPRKHTAELTSRLETMLQTGNAAPLESYLMDNSGLPGPRGNLELLNAFADVAGDLITQSVSQLEELEHLVDGWAALSVEAAPVTQPRVMLPCAAVLSYGQAAVSQPEWWDDEITKLHIAASDKRWRVREMVAAALQRMLAADWERTCAALNDWLQEDDPLVIRAAAAGVAEPPLLKERSRGEQALAIQERAVERMAAFPASARPSEDLRTLRQALGYTVSVAVAAAPESGFRLLEKLAASPDADVQWVVRENLKKNRLNPWADRVAAIQATL